MVINICVSANLFPCFTFQVGKLTHVYVKIHAPWDVLTRCAELIPLKMPIKVSIMSRSFHIIIRNSRKSRQKSAKKDGNTLKRNCTSFAMFGIANMV